jgi:molecular chaperone HtpG
MESLETFEGKKLESAMDADIPTTETAETKQAEDDVAPLVERMKKVLAGRVGEVKTTHRLTESAACLVLPESGLPPYIERILRAQQGNESMPASRRTLELNPSHPLVRSLTKLVREKPDAEEVDRYVELVYDQALLAEGSPLEDPRRIVSTLTSLLADAAGRLV